MAKVDSLGKLSGDLHELFVNLEAMEAWIEQEVEPELAEYPSALKITDSLLTKVKEARGEVDRLLDTELEEPR